MMMCCAIRIIKSYMVLVEGQARLEAALTEFVRACEARHDPSAVVRSGVFGAVSLSDYVWFQTYHTRHHTGQVSR